MPVCLNPRGDHQNGEGRVRGILRSTSSERRPYQTRYIFIPISVRIPMSSRDCIEITAPMHGEVNKTLLSRIKTRARKESIVEASPHLTGPGLDATGL